MVTYVFNVGKVNPMCYNRWLGGLEEWLGGTALVSENDGGDCLYLSDFKALNHKMSLYFVVYS